MKQNTLSIEDIRKTAEGLYFLLEEIEQDFDEMTNEKKEALIGLAFESSGKVAQWIYQEWLYRKEQQREEK